MQRNIPNKVCVFQIFLFLNFFKFLLNLYFSYDTEALNKKLQTIPDDNTFTNSFQNTTHKKVILGLQQLYMIGTNNCNYIINFKLLNF